MIDYAIPAIFGMIAMLAIEKHPVVFFASAIASWYTLFKAAFG